MTTCRERRNKSIYYTYSVECNLELDESSDMYLTPTTTSCRSIGCLFATNLDDDDVKQRIPPLASDDVIILNML